MIVNFNVLPICRFIAKQNLFVFNEKKPHLMSLNLIKFYMETNVDTISFLCGYKKHNCILKCISIKLNETNLNKKIYLMQT